MKIASRRLLAVAAFPALGALAPGCTPLSPLAERPPVRAGTDWRVVATEADRARLAGWRDDFTAALAEARAGGNEAAIRAEGPLLAPDAAIAGPAIPNGDYACRTIKLGRRGTSGSGLAAYPAFRCRIQSEGRVQGFAKIGGSQRQVGLVFPSDGVRQVFLATLQLGDETRPRQYGRDPQRDVAGWVERIGERRWRILLPSPAFESRLDVLELVPAP